MDRVKLQRWSCTRRTRGTFYGGSWGKVLMLPSSLHHNITLLGVLMFPTALTFSGLPVCVWRHAGFCVHKVEMPPLGIWHWWVSLWRCVHGTTRFYWQPVMGFYLQMLRLDKQNLSLHVDSSVTPPSSCEIIQNQS